MDYFHLKGAMNPNLQFLLTPNLDNPVFHKLSQIANLRLKPISTASIAPKWSPAHEHTGSFVPTGVNSTAGRLPTTHPPVGGGQIQLSTVYLHPSHIDFFAPIPCTYTSALPMLYCLSFHHSPKPN